MHIYVNNEQIAVKECTSFKDRLMGLMFKDSITPYFFPHCNSIHTFFMKQPIDVVMTDKSGKVISIYKNLKKNKVVSNHKAYNTYELPINTYKIELNDIIK